MAANLFGNDEVKKMFKILLECTFILLEFADIFLSSPKKLQSNQGTICLF